MTRLTQKALRFYDKKKFLVSGIKDAFTGYHCYSSSQIERGVKIRTLPWMKFSLKTMPAIQAAGTIHRTL